MSGSIRTRWAAIGAAVAVTLGTGGLMTASASGSQSVFVAITPTRVLDTRYDVGLDGAFRGNTSRKLDITGTIDYVASTNPDFSPNISRKIVVPDGATAIVANLTVTQPTNTGFVSIRPGTATGTPSTSNINIPAPGSDIPNSVTVELPTTGPLAGHVDLYYNPVGATTHLIMDIVGYYTEGTGTPGPAGPAGPEGPEGPTGPEGPEGPAGTDAESPARVIWVADDGTGDFTSLSAALASITDNSITNPYLIRIAPGTYTETETIQALDFVDIEGSGRYTTTLTCACEGGTVAINAVVNLSAQSELRNLAIVHPGGTDDSIGVHTSGDDAMSLKDVIIAASETNGTGNAYALYNQGGSPDVTRSLLLASGTVGSPSTYTYGVLNGFGASGTYSDVEIVAVGASLNTAFYEQGGSASELFDVQMTGADYGLRVSSGSPTVVDSEINGPVFTSDPSPNVVIRNSTIASVNATTGTVSIANTLVSGTVSGAGTITCVGAYSSSYTALDAACN